MITKHSILSILVFITFFITSYQLIIVTQATVVPTPSLQETTTTVDGKQTVSGSNLETLDEECFANDPAGSKCIYRFDQEVPKSTKDSNLPMMVDNELELQRRLETIDILDMSAIPKFDLDSEEWLAEGSDTTLRQVLFIHRHGDRTPIVFPPKDDLAKEPFWNFHGLGQLTNRGKARLYLLGAMTRARYDKFLGHSVNKNQRISRSSGSLRCIESAQMFLSGFLALNSVNSSDAPRLIWDKKFNKLSYLWQPASIQSVPTSMDGMLAESATCKVLSDEYDEVIDKSEFVKKINEEYRTEAEVLEKVLGFEVDRFYKWFWASSLIEVERSYFGDKMKPEIVAAFDRIQKAGELALSAYQSTLVSLKLRGGFLLRDMIDHMKRMRDLHSLGVYSESSEMKKLVHYAAHDLNLIVLLSMFENWNNYPKRPDYASNIAIELHEKNNEWFVKLFYMPNVPEKPIELYLSSCRKGNESESHRCTLDEFEKLMQPYLIENWESWMKKCGNNFSNLNPYIPGQ